MAGASVFHDPSQRRWRWFQRAAAALGIVSLALLTAFVFSLFLIPYLPPVPGVSGPLKHALKRKFSPLPDHEQRLRRALRKRSRALLQRESSPDRAQPAPARPGAAAPIVGAFYATWQEEGLHSLRANAGSLTHLFPEWLHLNVTGDGLDLYDFDLRITPRNIEALRIARASQLQIMPMLNNASHGIFDRLRIHLFLSDPERQLRLAMRLRDWLRQNHFQGVNIDFENLPDEDYARLPAALERLRTVLKPAGFTVSIDIEAMDTSLDWRQAARAADFAVVMAYDEHFQKASPGPVASIRWYGEVLAHALRDIPREKLVMGLANYAYDWSSDQPKAQSFGYQQALLNARDNNADVPPAKLIDFDPKALNPTYNYEDDKGILHEVWMLDAVTAGNQWRMAQAKGVRAAALWLLGSEDPSLWTFFTREKLASPPNLAKLDLVGYPFDIQYVGGGEILSVEAMPQQGSRRMEIDHRTGFVVDESYESLPTAYVIKRSGLVPKQVALTFDDGPSDPYTARILDALRDLGVPGTFFAIGQNIELHPDLVERIWREGHELGNHTFNHPNIANVSANRASLELTLTQRAIQSILGRSTILFRPPYNADAEPSTAEEVEPILQAARLGYLTVGEFIDPRDWDLEEAMPDGTRRRRTPEDLSEYIAQRLASGRGNAVLLHDGGGDRSLTAKLLRVLVPRLKAEGYRFVRASEMAGISREAAMPPVRDEDSRILGADRMVFEASYWVSVFLRVAFLSAIFLATVRLLMVCALALWARRRELVQRFDPAYHPSVSVLIAAHDEEGVIARTVEAVLANGPGLEVIVVDDGSRDRTADEIAERFRGDERVRLIRQENRGKAAALRAALAASSAEILVCLDADTQLAADAVAKLVRHFADPKVGAVAGNVKVGNRVNRLTRLQSIEYITSQNLDRRAYAQLNAVTVVPGAAGAWRRSAVEQAGGFLSDTLAEDMDLTWRIRRAGWVIANEPRALAFTEAPDNLSGLLRQRFRWTYGTLQCLWKHRGAVFHHGAFGWLSLPSLWLFQIAGQILAPLIDLQLLLALVSRLLSWLDTLQHSDIQPTPDPTVWIMLGIYFAFMGLELAAGWAAYGFDRASRKDLWLLPTQRFVYRQIMYLVVWRAVGRALGG
ncbi:MAG TPA: glycosyltransferase, partial [Elusimicrobiota bacterium]|nr:glycosyltransferase [Elusimicrobiota bacterium]